MLFAVSIPLLLALALPVVVVDRSWRRFISALLLSFLVVVLPLFTFFASCFLVPDWKGACKHGAWDCFFMGKLALTPLALMATAALYAVEVLRVEKPTEKWIVLGIFLGAVISVGCFLLGLAALWGGVGQLMLLMILPLYVAVWYAIRTVTLIRESGTGLGECLNTLLVTVPFWIGSVLWSESVYSGLPDAPACFIVTAAGRGHRRLVGPHMDVQHHGRRIQANRQLMTLWHFEELWRQRAPGSHAGFRRWYNQFGPVVAAQIQTPWLADLAYVAIKPAEWMARLAISAITYREMRQQ